MPASSLASAPPASWLAAATVVALPLALALARTPGALFGRLAQVAVTGATSGATAAAAGTSTSASAWVAMLKAVGASAWRTAGMVFVQGDRIARHNIPYRPVFGPLAAGLWILGAVVLLAWLRPTRPTRPTQSTARRRRAAALVLAATVAYALPTALAEDAPHFLRAVGLLPALVATAAVGGAALVSWADRRWGAGGRAAAWVVVAVAIALEGRDVGRYDAALAAGRALDPFAARTVVVVPDAAGGEFDDASVAEVREGAEVHEGADGAEGAGGDADAGGEAGVEAADVAGRAEAGGVVDGGAAIANMRSAAALWSRAYHAFEGGATMLARDVNATLSPNPFAARPGERVWLDRRLRDGWASVPFLIPMDRVTLTDPYDPVLFDEGGVAYLVPYGLRLDEVWAKLPLSATLAFDQAVMERGDRAPRASPLYVRATGPAAGAMELRIGASGEAWTILGFDGGPDLTAAAIVPEAVPLVDDRHRRSVVAVQVATQWVRRPQIVPPTLVPLADDVTLFVHVLDADGRRIDHGADAPLGQGVYPFGRWREDDVVIDRRTLWLPASAHGARVVIGVYAGDAAAPLRRMDGRGDGVTVDVGRVP
ncbi:MAG: hypothetical protein ABI780_06490 [Ardenticatenales bacterium]